MKLFDTNDPFFRPLWIRITIAAVCGLWSILEFVTGSQFWGVLFAALAVYCTWGFFINFKPEDPPVSKN